LKAYVCRRYGGPEAVELADVPKPLPKDDDLLIRIVATTVTAADWRVRALAVPKGLGPIARLALGLTRPRQPILGTELAGVVEAIGRGVTLFRPGDAVFAFPGGKMGCHAEYGVMSQRGAVALKPEALTFEQAASLCFGGCTALDFLSKAGIRAGESILIIGASGGVGAPMTQLAKHFGAKVTGVTSAGNRGLVLSLGADRVVDYAAEDFAESGETYDIIADTVGDAPLSSRLSALKNGGRLLAIAGGLPEMLVALRRPGADAKRVIAGPAKERPDYVRRIAELATSGALRPVIDRRYAFAQMAEAHAYVETRRKRGAVVVSVAQG